jgi:xanthine dehydrogenase small subunit
VEADTPRNQCVRFRLNAQEVTLPRPPPTRTLLEFLREDAGLTGTKEGCAEGDCGACTVVVGSRCADGTRWRAINSCIRFLPTVDGCEVLTVEGLSAEGEVLHPVQQAMVDAHASQCGFCTPGFVMSLLALYLTQSGATREQVIDALSGNLCRCTGYRPIIDAGVAMFEAPGTPPWSRQGVQAEAASARIAATARSAQEALDYPGFHAPRSLAAFAAARAAAPGALVLAGGTDVGLWVTKSLRELPPILYVGEVPELQALRAEASGLSIGAAVTASDAWPALVALCPTLAEQAARFASPPVRNSATLVGNLANGSPIGDSLPVLLALGASLTLRQGNSTRELPLAAFYLGYQKKDLRNGEFVVSVQVPAPAGDAVVASYKLAKRIDQDISAVSAGFLLRLDGLRVIEARLAFGGLAATARRAPLAEAALTGNIWNEASVTAACEALAADFQPLTDQRASARYRLEGAAALLRRHLAEYASRVPQRVTGSIGVLA